MKHFTCGKNHQSHKVFLAFVKMTDQQLCWLTITTKKSATLKVVLNKINLHLDSILV